MWHGLVQGVGARERIRVTKKRHCIPREKSAGNIPKQQVTFADLAHIRPVESAVYQLYSHSPCTLGFRELPVSQI